MTPGSNMFGPWRLFSEPLQKVPSAPVAIVSTVVLLLLAGVLLPKKRRLLRLPVVILFIAASILGFDMLLPPEWGMAKVLGLCSLCFSLTSAGRTLFILLVESILEGHFEGQLPKIFRDILQALIFLVGLFIYLRVLGVELGPLLTTSALLTAVIGLALQDTIGNVFAGLAIQFQRVVDIGDWIQLVSEKDVLGTVTEINWRSTKLVLATQVEVVIPNSVIAKATLKNFSRPSAACIRNVDVCCSYSQSPDHVRQTILECLRDTPEVLETPAPEVFTLRFDDSGVTYSARFAVSDFGHGLATESIVRDRIWYALRRASVEIPFPTRTVHMVPTANTTDEESLARIVRLLHKVDFLNVLPEESLQQLAQGARQRLYAPMETIIRQGDVGDELCVLHRGEVSVLAGRDGGSVAEVARLGPGTFFGEMSLLLGERRRATIRASTECDIITIGKDALQPIFTAHPEFIERISTVLSSRLVALDANLAERAKRAASMPPAEESKADFLRRVRAFFALG